MWSGVAGRRNISPIRGESKAECMFWLAVEVSAAAGGGMFI
jgi:hypothetical protein